MARNGFRALPMPRAGHKSRRSFQLRNVSYAHDVTWLPLLCEMFFGGERLVVRSVLSEQRVPQLEGASAFVHCLHQRRRVRRSEKGLFEPSQIELAKSEAVTQDSL
jgi:hypothetical protein